MDGLDVTDTDGQDDVLLVVKIEPPDDLDALYSSEKE